MNNFSTIVFPIINKFIPFFYIINLEISSPTFNNISSIFHYFFVLIST